MNFDGSIYAHNDGWPPCPLVIELINVLSFGASEERARVHLSQNGKAYKKRRSDGIALPPVKNERMRPDAAWTVWFAVPRQVQEFVVCAPCHAFAG